LLFGKITIILMNNHQQKELPYFSIVICTFNRAELLFRALNSLVLQEFKNFEVIIIDDGSTDNTYEVQKNFRSKIQNLRYIFQKKSGLPSARNLGVTSSRGKFITFLDSDDEFMSSHLLTRYLILEKNSNIDLLYGGIEVIGNPEVPDMNNHEKLIPIDDCIIGGTFFFKKSLFNRIDGFRMIDYGDDADFFKRAMESRAKILKTYEKTYIYHRDTEDSLCNNLLKLMSQGYE